MPVFSYYPVLQHSCLKVSSPLNIQSALIGQLTHAWSSNANKKKAAVLNQVSRPNLATQNKWCKWLTWWHCAMSQSPRIKGRGCWRGVSGAVFSVGEQSFHWCGLLTFWTFKIFYMHSNLNKTLKEWKTIKKHDRSPFRNGIKLK